MKKIFSVLMVLILIVLFTLTYYCSRRSEQLFTAQIETFNQISPGLIKIELQSYRRHFFSSNAITAVKIKGEKEIPLNHQIRHFIWGVKMTTSPVKEIKLAKSIALDIPHDQLQLITDINLLGASKSRFKLPEISFQAPTEHLKLTELNISWNLNADLTEGEFNCQLDNLRWQQIDQNEINLSGLKISSLLTNQQDIPLGNWKVQLEKLQVAESKGPVFEFHKIQYQGKTELVQDSYSSSATLKFAELFLAEEKLSNGQLQLTLSGIDSKLFRSFQQIAKQLQRKALQQQISPIELQFQMLGLYAQLLQSDLSLKLERLSLDTTDGHISSHGTLTLLNNGPAFSLKNIKADFQLGIDRDAFITGYRLFNYLQNRGRKKLNQAVLIEQAEQIAEGLIQKGFFSRQDKDTFQVNFSLFAGQGKLNGKLFQLN